MNFQDVILSLSFFSFMGNLRFSYSGVKERRDVNMKKKDCDIYRLTFQQCDMQVSRYGNEIFKLKYDKSCEIKDISFVFHFVKQKTYSRKIKSFKPVVTLSQMKKSLDKIGKVIAPGTHTLQATMAAKTLKNVELSITSDKCDFYVRNENATATLGDTNRVVKSGQSFLVDASRSENNDYEEKDQGLEYKWNCTSTNSFCNKPLGTDAIIRVPAKYAKEGDYFEFTVYVRSIPTDWQSAVQFIHVDNKSPYVVNCVKDCGKYPNTFAPNKWASVEATCQYSCEKYDEESFYGGIYKTEGNQLISSFEDFSGYNMISSANKSGMNITIAVHDGPVKVGKILGKTLFRVLNYPVLTNCKTIPPKGTTLTKFKVDCHYDDATRKYFEVKVKSGETVVFSTTAPKLDDITFLVSSKDAVVVVKLENTEDVAIEVEVPVQIESIMANENSSTAVNHLTDIYEGKNGTSVSELIKNGEEKVAVQMIDVVARELSNVKPANKKEREVSKELKKKLLNDIADVPIKDVDISKSVSGVMKLIAESSKDNVSDSEMAKVYAATCSNTAKQQRYLVENDIEDKISQKDVEDISGNLMSCGESEMSPYYEMFKETAIDIGFTTKFPINENLSEQNFEDYPQYVADDLIEQKVAEFLTAAESMVDICRDMTSSMINKVELDMENPKYVLREKSVFSWMKSSGTQLVAATFKQLQVTIHPSKSLSSYPQVSMQVCSYTEDPFWSVTENYKTPTNVIDLKLVDESKDEEITNFVDEPMNISFGVSQHLVPKKVSNTEVKKYDERSKFKEDEFTIIIVRARGEQSFFIDFHNIENKDFFEMVVVEMERPQIKHFDEPIAVNKKYNKIFIKHLEKSDKWFMLGIRPHRVLGSNKDLVFSVYTPMCVSWDSNEKNWKFACSVHLTTTSESIHCRCLHLSILAGTFEYNQMRVHPKFIRLEFALEDARNLFFMVVAVLLFMVYFFLLLYAIQKNETIEDTVYLMSDVPAENRFAYLVVVETGRRIHSGTTSHIVIRLIGKDSQSQEHVINFPDPLGEFLQTMQKDLFVLATPVHLGELVKIQVWFDCTGMSPTWYCHYFRVCDLQTKKWYFFKIDKWFKVEGKPMIFMSVTTTAKNEESKENLKRFRVLIKALQFGRFTRTLFQMSTNSSNINFGYPKRLSLILSVILTLLTVSIEVYGRPELTHRDSITPKCYFRIETSIFLNGIYSALSAFFPHLAIMEGFKNSRLQFQSKSAKDSKHLPPALTIVFWCILVLNITLQLHYVLIYGYRVVQPKAYQCFAASVFGFIFYVFVLDYLHNFFTALFGGPMKTLRYNYEKILKNVEEQRRLLYKFIGRYVYRPLLTPIYKIMSTGDLVRKKFHFRQKREMIWQVHDFFMVVIFILLLYIIVLGNKDSIYDYRGHTQIVRLIEGNERSRYKLQNLTHLKDFEDFIERELIPAIQSYQWYGRYVSVSPGMCSDAANKYMGVIRFRQHRVEDDTCVVLDQMKFLNVTCKAPNYFFNFDTYNYTPAWNTTIPEFHKSRLGYVWGHQFGVGKFFLGLTGYYESGGYIAQLGRTIQNSYVNFNYLKRYNWIDSLTRAVVIEFCLYNVNLNLFHFVELVLERSATGYISKELTVQTERVMKHSSGTQKIAMVCCIFFMILVLALAVRTVMRIFETKVWFKNDAWHILDVTIIFVSAAWITLFFRRMAVLLDFAKHLEEKQSNEFVNYFPILSITDCMKTLESLLICLWTMRMWKILRFGVSFRTCERTLVYSASSLFIMSFYYIIFLIGFGIPTYAILGAEVEQFKHPYFVFKTLILKSIELFDIKPEEVAQNERGLGYAFFVLHSCYCKLFITVFIAILLVEHRKAREFSLNEILDYNLKDYTVESYGVLKKKAYILARKFRLTAGGTPSVENATISPKHDDLRYKNCIETDSNRMKAMACVAKCVLLKLQKGLRVDEADQGLMLRTVMNLCNKDEGKKEIFFIETTSHSKFKVVDDRKLLMMEKLVKLMLQTPEERAKRTERIRQEEELRTSNMSRIMRMNDRMKLMCEVIKNIEVAILSNLEDV